MIKFLADMPISIKTVQFLREKGYDIYHLREKNLQRLSDEGIIKLARRENRVILTADLDFSFLSFLSRKQFPSVIIFRLEDETSEHINALLSKYLPIIERQLISGAIVIFEESRVRIRKLPII
ncbi:DUF5615 family PIN-like protein [Candidatus Calescamantes bacterium]|nr:DUF5615 family PIN-like protein [Candidatus Calescamantes bacterium]